MLSFFAGLAVGCLLTALVLQNTAKRLHPRAGALDAEMKRPAPKD